MDTNDRQAIEGLFAKLANVERQAPPRDPDAEAYIREQISRQPGAPYFMAQTIVVQEQALNAAQSRIEELEGKAAAGPSSAGGLLAGMLGDRRRPSRSAGSVPSVARSAAPEQPAQGFARGGGGGFLAGAAQTAMGVAGGILLGNMIAGMFGGEQAQAGEAPPDDAPPEDAAMEDAGLDDAGFDDVEF